MCFISLFIRNNLLCGFLLLTPKSGESFTRIAWLDIYFLKKMLMHSIINTCFYHLEHFSPLLDLYNWPERSFYGIQFALVSRSLSKTFICICLNKYIGFRYILNKSICVNILYVGWKSYFRIQATQNIFCYNKLSLKFKINNKIYLLNKIQIYSTRWEYWTQKNTTSHSPNMTRHFMPNT